jgi:hypothetical protein
MFGLIREKDLNITRLYRLGFWYKRLIKNDKETNWLKIDKLDPSNRIVSN